MRIKAHLFGLLLACALAAAAASWPAAAQQQESLGRLFFTPAQRASLDVARSQRARATLSTERTEETATPVAQSITYGGMVRRSDGKNTVWINGRPVNDREPVGGVTLVGRVGADGSVTLQVPQSGRSVDLRPGQSVELLSGAIEESYSRRPVAPEAKPPAKSEGKSASGEKGAGKPSPEEIAKAEREREEQDQRRLEDALRAIQDAGTLKPAPEAKAPQAPSAPLNSTR
jgi:hypothetical protein